MFIVRSIQLKFFVETKDMYRERVYATARLIIIIMIIMKTLLKTLL